MTCASCDRSTTELIWDTHRRGTAAAGADTRITTGEGADWSAEQLLATAVGTCLMRTFLELAAHEGIEILGYVSSNRVELSVNDARPVEIRISPCIVVSRPEVARRLGELCDAAVRTSAVGRALHVPVVVVPQIAVIERVAGVFHGGG